MDAPERNIAVIGAGPAGLTAAWQLNKSGFKRIDIFESDNQVGGISRTVLRGVWRFDLGGHRFFSKSSIVNELWDEMLLPATFMHRPRKSRIFYRGRYFDYPLKPLNALFNLGMIETVRCILSYIWVRIKPPKEQNKFEGWVAARFGWRLYRIFFKTYTEKVWGISTRELNSTWAAQRIKNLSLLGAIKDAFGFKSKSIVTTLIDSFKYPQFGPGQLWESVADKLIKSGATLSMETAVESISFDGQKYTLSRSTGGSYVADAVFSSIPLSAIPRLLDAPAEILEAAEKLRYRDFLIVAVPVLASKELFNDNWIYIHDPTVRVGRIQNYLSWSPDLVAPGTSCLGLEYFVNKNDEIWDSPDEALISNAKKELILLNLKCQLIEDEGYVVRVEKAYPVYDDNYQASVRIIKDWLTSNHPSWYQLGRNGQHHYNNQDHSMLTAVCAVNNFIGVSQEDFWNVNLGDDYHEEIKLSRDAPIISS